MCASSVYEETASLALRGDGCSESVHGEGGAGRGWGSACRTGVSLGEAPGRSSSVPVARSDGVRFRCVKGR